MRIAFLIIFLNLGWLCWSQPSTEVWLFDISPDGELSNAINVSSNPGYDNQPSFTRGGNKLLFTSTRNGQTDIISYDIRHKEKNWLTTTPGSEYSPTQIPGSYTFSSILLEENGRQLLWLYSLNGGSGEVLIPFVKIGYHTWLNDEELYAFVLGPHPTLQHLNVSTQRAEIIQEDIGRSLLNHNDKIIYVDKSNQSAVITSLDPTDQSRNKIIDTLEGSEDFTISSDGYIYMGKEDKLFRTQLIAGGNWEKVADLSDFGRSGITRLSISPDNSKIAIVLAE
jgi:hypothetical protein